MIPVPAPVPVMAIFPLADRTLELATDIPLLLSVPAPAVPLKVILPLPVDSTNDPFRSGTSDDGRFSMRIPWLPLPVPPPVPVKLMFPLFDNTLLALINIPRLLFVPAVPVPLKEILPLPVDCTKAWLSIAIP